MNVILEQINSMSRTFVEFTWPMLLQSSALIVILLLVDLLLRKKVRAVFRYWLWMLVLVKLVLPTTLSTPVSIGYWLGEGLASIKVVEKNAAVSAAEIPQMMELTPIEVSRQAPTVVPPEDIEPMVAEASAASVTPVTWQGVVFLVWVAVVTGMGLLLLQRAIFVRGLVAQAKNPDNLMNDVFEFFY